MSRVAGTARLMWVVDGEAIDSGALSRALRAGIRWLHLRDDGIEPSTWDRLLEGAPGGVRIVVNGGPPWARDRGWGAHLKAARAGIPGGRREGWRLLGRSVHDRPETLAALADRPDYLVAGPVFPTSSKPGHAGIGPSGLGRIVDAAGDCPVFAIGGIRPAHVGALVLGGAYGVAVRSGITAAGDPAAAVRAYAGRLPVDANEPHPRGAAGLGPRGPHR